MNKQQLIQALKDQHGLSDPEASKIVDLFFDEMAHALSKGDRVEIRGLCTLAVKRYKAYQGRNPKTGQKVKVKSKKLPCFKAGTDLKKRLNSN
jgi:integration host factor subunit beta